MAVYTATLLISPIPVMPFERGTREFTLSLIACGIILSAGSLYTLIGERRSRSLLGMKLIAASSITLLFGIGLLVGSLVYLALTQT